MALRVHINKIHTAEEIESAINDILQGDLQVAHDLSAPANNASEFSVNYFPLLSGPIR